MIILFQKRRTFFIHTVRIPFLLCCIENRKDIQPVNSHAFLAATFKSRQMVVYHASSECAIAAPTNPKNNGCALFGRLLNSGCACVPMNQG